MRQAQPEIKAQEATLQTLTSAESELAGAARDLAQEAETNGTPTSIAAAQERLETALKVLRGEVSIEGAPHKMCNLNVQEVALGTQVTFTIPKGMSGKMVLDAIEKANPRSSGDGVVWPDSSLLNDAGLNYKVVQDTQYTTTICFNSHNRTRSEQASYLKDNGLGFTDRWILTVAAALYRDANGFPSDRSDIGSSEDKGNLLKGKAARAGSGAVKTYVDGLSDLNYRDDFRDGHVVAAGSSPSN